MYIPNARLTSFHNRSPWFMLPRTFRGLGYEVTLVCGELATQCPEGVRLAQTGLVVKTEGTLVRRGLFRSLIEPLLAFREIATREPDLVIVSPIRSSLVAILGLVLLYRHTRSRSTRFVLKADSSLDNTALNPLIALLSNSVLALASHILDLVSVETSCAVDRAKELRGIDMSKVVRVQIGFPQGLIRPNTYQGTVRAPVILCVARIARMKGQDVLLRAFSMLAGKYPSWSVRLVGPEEDRTFKQELVGYIVSQSLERKVTFTGAVDENTLDLEYSMAAIFCLPSVELESAGQVKYEATACGVPVVTTDVPCGRDATDMGWLVARAGDPVSLASQLEVLMADEHVRRKTAERAQRLQSSYEEVAAQYLHELNKRGATLPYNYDTH